MQRPARSVICDSERKFLTDSSISSCAGRAFLRLLLIPCPRYPGLSLQNPSPKVLKLLSMTDLRRGFIETDHVTPYLFKSCSLKCSASAVLLNEWLSETISAGKTPVFLTAFSMPFNMLVVFSDLLTNEPITFRLYTSIT